jgi:hypothetical protein
MSARNPKQDFLDDAESLICAFAAAGATYGVSIWWVILIIQSF